MIRPGRDIPWKRFVKDLWRATQEDRIADTAASLAYYGMLALFPFVVFVVTVGGLLLDPHRISQIVAQLARVVPAQAVDLIEGRLHEINRQSGPALLVVSILASLWVASGGVTSLIRALNRAYDVVETRPFWRLRPLAIGRTLVAVVLAALGGAIMFGVPLVGAWIGGTAGEVIGWVRFPAAALVMMCFWAFLYWALPNVKPHRFQIITPGSVIGVLVWLVASWGFGQYVAHFNAYGATYGALAGVVVLLVWMWLSATVVLVGAEINKLLTPKEKLQHAPTGERTQGHREPLPTT